MALILSAVSCAVISRDVRYVALQDVPFGLIAREPEKFKGQTVILGGYILEAENTEGQTVLQVLQAPLDFSQRPVSRDSSEGRMSIYHNGYLDPEIYEKGREITVAGVVRADAARKHKGPYLEIESREIYLWPEYEDCYRYHAYEYPYRYYHPYGYPYLIHRRFCRD